MQWENAAIVHRPCTSPLKMHHSIVDSVISLSALNVRTAFPKLALRLHLTGCRIHNYFVLSGELMNLKLSSSILQNECKSRKTEFLYHRLKAISNS